MYYLRPSENKIKMGLEQYEAKYRARHFFRSIHSRTNVSLKKDLPYLASYAAQYQYKSLLQYYLCPGKNIISEPRYSSGRSLTFSSNLNTFLDKRITIYHSYVFALSSFLSYSLYIQLRYTCFEIMFGYQKYKYARLIRHSYDIQVFYPFFKCNFRYNSLFLNYILFQLVILTLKHAFLEMV